ncbi:MAG: metallophosphoesterase, partial [Actinomycetota bacterium]|nr:metallophosphoesterase [Actinomycetota bacterium]
MWSRRRNLGALLAGASLAAGAYYANRIEPARVEVRELSLVLHRLQREFDGYRLALISDIHMDGWMTLDRIASILELLNDQEPDLVAIAGDYVTDTVMLDSRELSNALSQIEAKDGVVGVLGNHDYQADQRMIRRLIHQSDIVELANDVYTVRRGDAALHVAG